MLLIATRQHAETTIGILCKFMPLGTAQMLTKRIATCGYAVVSHDYFFRTS